MKMLFASRVLICLAVLTGLAEAAKKRPRAREWSDVAGEATVKAKTIGFSLRACALTMSLPADVEEMVRDGLPVRIKTGHDGRLIQIVDGDYRATIGKACEKVTEIAFKLQRKKPYAVREGAVCPAMTFLNYQSCKDRLDGVKAKAVVTYGGGTGSGCRRGQPVVHRGHEGVVWSVSSIARRA